MERTSPVLAPLLTPLKQAILAATILQPDRRWYFTQLARHLGVRPSSIQRELAMFVSAGLLSRERDGNRVYYQADRSCPIFAELEQLLLKTTGLVDVVRRGIEPIRKKLDLAFIYGSIASAKERTDSDIDLMLVGGASLAEVSPLLRPVERRLGRMVNPTVYTTREFSKRLKDKSHFLTRVLKEPALFIHGGRDQLAQLARRPTSRTAQDESPRTE
jgi:DNA-binding transcriptional ArsR family regulator